MAEVPSFDKLFIGGEWVEPVDQRPLRGRLALHREVIGVHAGRVADRHRPAVAAARDRLRRRARGRGCRPPSGPTPCSACYDLISRTSNDLAELITAEVGAPLLFSHLGQIGAAGMVLDYFVNLTRTYAFEEVRPGLHGPGPRPQGAGRRRAPASSRGTCRCSSRC